jgi:DNA-directed RNA polymerase
MQPVLDSLNVIGACPWRINTPVLDIIIDVFNRGAGRHLDVPEPADKAPAVPTRPVLKYDDKGMPLLMPKDQYLALGREIAKARQVQAEMHSLWCTELYRLSIANMYRDKILWFPHSLDFRGRSYTIAPHFNHLGGDISRSIIMLAEGKKLGDHGLDMLKLHLMNLTGTMKKSSLAERLAHANTLLSEILDSAARPMNGRGWWQKAEDRWQALACCMEISNALAHPTGPQDYVSHFPVHQDGSCNGLQHYAALGRDLEGAHSVNLAPAERPRDVYSAVLDIVERERVKDEANNEIGNINSSIQIRV